MDNDQHDNFEFDAPMFTDFAKSAQNDLSEEFCQHYFDKKCEEIKRASLELEKENININDIQEASMDIDEENDAHQPIANLLSATDFANTSILSNKSNKSTKSNRSCKISAHLYDLNKIQNKHNNTLSTEEMELQKLQQQKAELSKLLEKNAKNVAKMKEDYRVFHPVRSTKLTIPITPALHTTVRAQQRIKKRKISTASSATMSTSTISNISHISTIENKDKDNHNNKHNEKLKPTIPQSFKLSKTKKRRRTATMLTTEEKQLREIEKHGHFQARKLNQKIFKANAANLGILNNIKNKPTTTTIQPFQFMTEKRAQKHNNNIDQKS